MEEEDEVVEVDEDGEEAFVSLLNIITAIISHMSQVGGRHGCGGKWCGQSAAMQVRYIMLPLLQDSVLLLCMYAKCY